MCECIKWHGGKQGDRFDGQRGHRADEVADEVADEGANRVIDKVADMVVDKVADEGMEDEVKQARRAKRRPGPGSVIRGRLGPGVRPRSWGPTGP